jgi:diguanylate cyclase (GGDEF)-like protein
MRLIDAMRQPITIKGKTYNIGISLGVALFPEHASDDEMLMRRADMAMYRAKQKRNAFVMYDPNIDRPKQNV